MDSSYQYSGGYHEREGHVGPSSPRDNQKPSWAYIPNSLWTWVFSLTVLVQALLALGLEGYIFREFEDDLKDHGSETPVAKLVPTYLSLFIFGFLFQLFMVYDALRLKNTIQVIGVCLLNVGLLIEAAIQYEQIRDALNLNNRTPDAQIRPDFLHTIHPFVIIIPCVMGGFTVFMGFIAWKLYDEFAWSIYKNISADLRLKKRYLSYQIYIALLKFDFFFFLAFTVQFLVVVRNTADIEFYLTIAAIPITIIILLAAAWFTQKETLIGMILIIIVYLAALAYFFFKLLRMYVVHDPRASDYTPAKHSLTTFAILTILLLFATLFYAIVCSFNFKKGLRPHVDRKRRRARTGSDMDKLYGNEMPLNGAPAGAGVMGGGGGGGGRMTID